LWLKKIKNRAFETHDMEREADAPTRGFPLAEPARVAVLRALCAVAEGADIIIPVSPIPPAVRTSAAACVAAVLGDACRRLSILGGRDGMPRSLGSVYGSSVTLFLSGLCGKASRVIKTPGVRSWSNGVAVSRDGTTLLVSDSWGGSGTIYAFDVHTGVHLRTIGCKGDGPLQFKQPRQVWVASDDYVFVAEYRNNRIQILTPREFGFHGFVGVGQLRGPSGVCADDDIVAVSEPNAHRISVFKRGDSTLICRFGSRGSGDGQLKSPLGLCFMSGHRHVAVADYGNHLVSVFSVEGEFVRTVGVGELRGPQGVACSAFGEIVVANYGSGRVVVFSASGELLHTMGHGGFTGVAIHGGTIFAQTWNKDKCVLFT
jgi:DNA-binding beta-propeller fold protein YncE